MRGRTVVVAVAAAGLIALLWAPYFRSFGGGPIHLADLDAGFVSLWLARAAVALVVLSAVLTFTNLPRAATAASVLAMIATLAAGIVPAWRVLPSNPCRWASYDGVPPDPCGLLAPTWGWGVALLLTVAAATAPLWAPATAPAVRRTATVAAAIITVATVLVASFAPVFRVPRTFPRRYADYLLTGPLPRVNAWHGGFAPAGLLLLVLASVLIVARHSSAAMVAALAVAAIAVAGVDRPTHTVPVSLGWGYWNALAGAAAVLAVTLLPKLPGQPRPARLVTAPV